MAGAARYVHVEGQSKTSNANARPVNQSGKLESHVFRIGYIPLFCLSAFKGKLQAVEIHRFFIKPP